VIRDFEFGTQCLVSIPAPGFLRPPRRTPNPEIRCLGNKARAGRVSRVLAQFSAIWGRSAPQGDLIWLRKALTIMGRE
jgi:hypothetical protein